MLGVMVLSGPEKGEPGEQLAAEPFSESRLISYREAGTPVLVNMTADWCLTCKVNEQTTFANARVARFLQDQGVRYLVGDWTDGDSVITDYLTRYKAAGVPLYVLYTGEGRSIVLPQILTPQLLIDSIEEAVNPYDGQAVPVTSFQAK